MASCFLYNAIVENSFAKALAKFNPFQCAFTNRKVSEAIICPRNKLWSFSLNERPDHNFTKH